MVDGLHVLEEAKVNQKFRQRDNPSRLGVLQRLVCVLTVTREVEVPDTRSRLLLHVRHVKLKDFLSSSRREEQRKEADSTVQDASSSIA